MHKPTRFPALTGLRAVAAYSVFLYHSKTSKLFSEGWRGVPVFFVLSGLLITYRYQDSARLDWRWLGRYFRNRFARIYPVYGLLCVLTLWVLGEHSTLIWLTNLTLVKGFSHVHHLEGINQAWSLTVEETFYFLAPLFFVLLGGRSIWFGVVVCYAMGGVLSIWEPWRFVRNWTFFGRALEFWLGIYLARALRAPRIPAPLAIIRHPTYVGIVGMLGTALAAHEVAHLGWDETFLDLGVFPFFVALLLWGLIRERTAVSGWLSTPLMDLLGRSSYVFYLVHVGVIATWVGSWKGGVIFDFVALNLTSLGIYLMVEKPLHEGLRATS